MTAALALSACSGSVAEPVATSSASSSSSSTTTSPPPRSDDHGSSEQDKRLSADSTGARAAAGQVMRAIAKTDRDAKAWGSAVEDNFTSIGKQQLDLLRRKDLPFTAVTGKPQLLATEKPSMSHWPIIVSTNRGKWMVTMTQQGQDWRVEAISKWDR